MIAPGGSHAIAKRQRVLSGIVVALEALTALGAIGAVLNWLYGGAAVRSSMTGLQLPPELAPLYREYMLRVYEDSLPQLVGVVGLGQIAIAVPVILGAIWVLTRRETGPGLLVRFLPVAALLLAVQQPISWIGSWRAMGHMRELVHTLSTNMELPAEASGVSSQLMMAAGAGTVIVTAIFAFLRIGFYAYCWVFFKRTGSVAGVAKIPEL